MTTYYVSAAGDNGAGTSWATAKQSFTAGLALATTAGDVILVDKDHTEELGADTTYTFTADTNVICVDKDSSDALSTMGTAAWIGNSTSNRSITIAGAFKKYFYGITFRTAGSTADSIILASTDGAHEEYESCYLWNGNTGASIIRTGSGGGGNQYVKLLNTTLRFGATGQSLNIASGNIEVNGGSVSSSGTAPSIFITSNVSNGNGMGSFNGVDLSHITGTLLGDCTIGPRAITFTNCELGAGVAFLATQTNVNKGSGSVTLFNCSTDDTHYHFGYSDSFGALSVETGIYASDGAEYNLAAAKYSWKIVTSAACTYYTPFVTPWIHKHHEGTSAITPSLEGFRDGSTTIIQNDEVWAEFSYQGTTGFSLGVIVNSGRMSPNGSPANQTSSKTYSDWQTGTTADSTFKLATSATITPQEIGNLSARVCVGEKETTVYVDPQIRT